MGWLAIAGLVWMAVLGQWSTLAGIFLSLLLAKWSIALLLLPGFLFVFLEKVALRRGRYIAGGLFLLRWNFWTFVAIGIYCVGCFPYVFYEYTGGSRWPWLLSAYGMASWALRYAVIANARGLFLLENTTGTETAFLASVVFYGAHAGAIAVAGVVLFEANPSAVDAIIAFCIPALVAFALQSVFSVAVVAEAS